MNSLAARYTSDIETFAARERRQMCGFDRLI